MIIIFSIQQTRHLGHIIKIIKLGQTASTKSTRSCERTTGAPVNVYVHVLLIMLWPHRARFQTSTTCENLRTQHHSHAAHLWPNSLIENLIVNFIIDLLTCPPFLMNRLRIIIRSPCLGLLLWYPKERLDDCVRVREAERPTGVF